jgi:hypothetical protein
MREEIMSATSKSCLKRNEHTLPTLLPTDWNVDVMVGAAAATLSLCVEGSRIAHLFSVVRG